MLRTAAENGWRQGLIARRRAAVRASASCRWSGVGTL